MPTFTGSTKDAGGTFLGAEFWKKGKRVEGTVLGTFQTQNGESYNVRLTKAVKVNGHDEDVVSIGNLKGFMMALRAAQVPGGLQEGDLLIVECIGETPTTKGNPQIDFKVAVSRKDNGKF